MTRREEHATYKHTTASSQSYARYSDPTRTGDRSTLGSTVAEQWDGLAEITPDPRASRRGALGPWFSSDNAPRWKVVRAAAVAADYKRTARPVSCGIGEFTRNRFPGNRQQRKAVLPIAFDHRLMCADRGLLLEEH